MTLQFMQGEGFEPRTPTKIGLETIAVDTKSIILCTHQYTFYDLSLMSTCPHPRLTQASKWILIPKLILKIPSSKPPSGNAARLSTCNTVTRISFFVLNLCIFHQGNYRIAERRWPWRSSPQWWRVGWEHPCCGDSEYFGHLMSLLSKVKITPSYDAVFEVFLMFINLYHS